LEGKSAHSLSTLFGRLKQMHVCSGLQNSATPQRPPRGQRASGAHRSPQSALCRRQVNALGVSSGQQTHGRPRRFRQSRLESQLFPTGHRRGPSASATADDVSVGAT
jgi:hypothetical protein